MNIDNATQQKKNECTLNSDLVQSYEDIGPQLQGAVDGHEYPETEQDSGGALPNLPVLVHQQENHQLQKGKLSFSGHKSLRPGGRRSGGIRLYQDPIATNSAQPQGSS